MKLGLATASEFLCVVLKHANMHTSLINMIIYASQSANVKGADSTGGSILVNSIQRRACPRLFLSKDINSPGQNSPLQLQASSFSTRTEPHSASSPRAS